MKIDVTYEKADILQLVLDDLRRKGLQVAQGKTPAYKGPLEVKLSVDVEDVEPAVAEPKAVVKTAEEPTPPRKDEERPPEGPTNMGDVLGASESLMTRADGPFSKYQGKRPLGPNESEEWPGD